MADERNNRTDQDVKNPSATEQAEGSRESAQRGNVHQQAAGITNRPLEQEREEQDSLPPRGKSKDGSHA
jgi:hypothetical protein